MCHNLPLAPQLSPSAAGSASLAIAEPAMQSAPMIFGKIIGAVIGFRLAALPGLLIGLILGHLVDGWLAKSGLNASSLNPWARRQQLFTDCVIALSAKLAKVDGPVTRAEVDAFKTEFRIAQGQLRTVGTLYDKAKRTAEGYEPYAQRLGSAFADAPVLLAGVLDALRRIALADGPIQPAESEFLARVASGASAASGATEEDPYATLGVARTATTDEIKAAWRELVRQHHPDTLTAKGLPKEYVELATRKMAAINAAYDRIRAERGET
jgi:DnaJ like chaperone protein